MLAGIYYGAQYGGSTTAILINLPGEASSAVTAIDGYQMARQGKAGTALSIAAIGSFIAGTVSTLLVAGFAAPLTSVALTFGPVEYFSLMTLGLVASITLANGSLLKAIAMILLGLLLGTIGTDIYSGQRTLHPRARWPGRRPAHRGVRRRDLRHRGDPDRPGARIAAADRHRHGEKPAAELA